MSSKFRHWKAMVMNKRPHSHHTNPGPSAAATGIARYTIKIEHGIDRYRRIDCFGVAIRRVAGIRHWAT